MTAHLFDHVRAYLDRSVEEKIAYIQAPRWVGYPIAEAAHARLAELLARPPGLRTHGLMIVGPYANGKTMLVERFAVDHLKMTPLPQRKVWIVQTREGAGLVHFYGSILHALRAPICNNQSIGRKIEQIDRLFEHVKPKVLIFDEFHNALRGRSRDIEAIFAFLRRIGRQYDISPVLVGEVSVFDCINTTSEMASRFELQAAPRWRYDEDYLALLDSLEAAMPLARSSDLSDEPLARKIHELSEGLIGEIFAIITRAALVALRSGKERITRTGVNDLHYIPVSRRGRAPQRDCLL
ncbi:TniB family NTP-binding protein [Rhizobium rhizogenes]|uniref:TniB NTP-binding protein n=1 Tax=Rhizobium rhizogenes (strain K84 / ATCC BAA-868) TaxID=311403 RepID=B9JNU4_RHIR8|nr:TniB NTP-binding protein [Rhizobium rhizogenes K84]